MNEQPSKASVKAQKAFKVSDDKKAVTELETEKKAFFDNRQRLKAERLAREAEA